MWVNTLHECDYGSISKLPWYNCTGWLGVNIKLLTYFLAFSGFMCDRGNVFLLQPTLILKHAGLPERLHGSDQDGMSVLPTQVCAWKDMHTHTCMHASSPPPPTHTHTHTCTHIQNTTHTHTHTHTHTCIHTQHTRTHTYHRHT